MKIKCRVYIHCWLKNIRAVYWKFRLKVRIERIFVNNRPLLILYWLVCVLKKIVLNLFRNSSVRNVTFQTFEIVIEKSDIRLFFAEERTIIVNFKTKELQAYYDFGFHGDIVCKEIIWKLIYKHTLCSFDLNRPKTSRWLHVRSVWHKPRPFQFSMTSNASDSRHFYWHLIW